jgi:Ureide permease
VGFATADLVQAYPIVSTIWDIVLFGEYRLLNTPSTTTTAAATTTETTSCSYCHRVVTMYLVIMYVLYLGGIVSILLSFTA